MFSRFYASKPALLEDGLALRSHDLPHGVAAPEGVRHEGGAFRIVLPLPVHQEAVTVRTRFQLDGRLPQSAALPV